MQKQTAVEMVKKFFSGTNDNFVSIRDIMITTGRNLDEEKKNNQWIANKLSSIREFNLVKKHKVTQHGKHRLLSISLTLEGQNLLGRVSASPSSSFSPSANNSNQTGLFKGLTPATSASKSSSSISNVLKAIAEFERFNPDIEIEYKVKLRGNSSVAGKS